MHDSQRRDRRGSTSNMNRHAHASPTQAADLADYPPPYSEEMRQERLAPFKCPKYIVEMDALPKNPNGKILKRELRDQYSDLPADLDEAKG